MQKTETHTYNSNGEIWIIFTRNAKKIIGLGRRSWLKIEQDNDTKTATVATCSQCKYMNTSLLSVYDQQKSHWEMQDISTCIKVKLKKN